MRAAIEGFILYLATERGLSDNYQLSTRLSLEAFVRWLERRKIGEAVVEQLLAAGDPLPDVDVRVGEITLEEISAYLGHRKRSGLSAASIKLVVVAIKIFFRWLLARDFITRDPADVLSLPRI